MDNLLSSQVELIREVFHYQSRFEGSTMVFKIDFPVTTTPGFPGLVKDLALLAKTGFKIIIVPGVKESIDAIFSEHGLKSEYAMTDNFPIRITTQKSIQFVEMAAFNAVSKFMTFLSGSRVDAILGNFVRARGLGVVNGIDTEHTGTVDKIYVDSLNKVLNQGMIPIIPCIGWSPSGKPYNVPSDEIALAVSVTLNAKKLFIVSMKNSSKTEYFNDSSFKIPEGIETRLDGSIIRLTPQQTENLIDLNFNQQAIAAQANPALYSQFKLGLKASKAGVHRVHLVDGSDEGVVLTELFSNLGAGTMIYTDEYDSIRSMHSRDLPDILRLMEPLMQNGVLVRRTAEDIQNKKSDYYVLEIDGSIRACGALYKWNDQGEIAAIATDPLYSDLGIGRKIVNFLIEKAKKAGMKKVFVLTTKTQDWFESIGFKEVSVESLPEEKLKKYDKKRASKIYTLNL